MSRKNEDSIERFFRKAVNQSDTRYREADWKSMEAMLDAEGSTQKVIRTKKINAEPMLQQRWFCFL